MGRTFGRQLLSPVAGIPVQVIADGNHQFAKVGGVTIDWSLVAAVSSTDVTLDDGTVIKVGKKYLRYGQVITKVTQAEITTVNVSGDDDPTGGTFPLNITGTTFDGVDFDVDLEDDAAFDVSAANLQAAIRALDFPGASLVTVSKSGFVYTITFPPESGNVVVSSNNGADLTGGGGDTFAITIGTSSQGVSNAGFYGPYDPNATDGRQTLTRGNCYFLNETILEEGLDQFTGGQTNHPAAYEGGAVWKDRILMTSGTHSLAAGPTVTEFLAAFPLAQFVNS